MIGAYVFPGWESKAQWSVIKDTPYLGRYDTARVDVANWHVKWAAEHGVDFFAFDWYWHLGKETLNAQVEAFMQADNLGHTKFCLHACNETYFHPKPGGNWEKFFDFGLQWEIDPDEIDHDFSRQDFLDRFSYVADRYFSSPRYLRVDGKEVYIQYRANLIMRLLGVERTREIYDDVRRMLREKGHQLYLIAGGSCTHPEYLSLVKDAGFDAVTGYNHPLEACEILDQGARRVARGRYSDVVESYKQTWNRVHTACRSAGVDYVPPLLSGFDNSPWSGSVIVEDPTAEAFGRMCENVKPYLTAPHRMTIVCAWNEWGERSVIEPSHSHGFSYLDAIREAFTDAAPHEQHEGPAHPERFTVTRETPIP